jgi:hypothetical protein
MAQVHTTVTIRPCPTNLAANMNAWRGYANELEQTTRAGVPHFYYLKLTGDYSRQVDRSPFQTAEDRW